VQYTVITLGTVAAQTADNLMTTLQAGGVMSVHAKTAPTRFCTLLLIFQHGRPSWLQASSVEWPH
jgi:hypothetical protein